jgi:hypothetical protein
MNIFKAILLGIGLMLFVEGNIVLWHENVKWRSEKTQQKKFMEVLDKVDFIYVHPKYEGIYTGEGVIPANEEVTLNEGIKWSKNWKVSSEPVTKNSLYECSHGHYHQKHCSFLHQKHSVECTGTHLDYPLWVLLIIDLALLSMLMMIFFTVTVDKWQEANEKYTLTSS